MRRKLGNVNQVREEAASVLLFVEGQDHQECPSWEFPLLCSRLRITVLAPLQSLAPGTFPCRWYKEKKRESRGASEFILAGAGDTNSFCGLYVSLQNELIYC